MNQGVTGDLPSENAGDKPPAQRTAPGAVDSINHPRPGQINSANPIRPANPAAGRVVREDGDPVARDRVLAAVAAMPPRIVPASALRAHRGPGGRIATMMASSG